MGANAQTAVPAFTAGQVLTAAQQTQINTGVPVFATTTTRDAAFGGTGEKVLAQGQLAFIEASNIVQYYNGTSWLTLAPTTSGVIQVKSTTKSDTFTTTSSSFTDITGLSVSITPTSASNNVLVIMAVNGAGVNGLSLGPLQLVRGSTAIAIGDAAGSRIRATTVMSGIGSNDQSFNGMNFLDSPATTSATTYKVQVRSFSGQSMSINRGETDTDSGNFVRTVSTITVMEVAP